MAEPQYLVLEDGSMFPRPALESDEHHSPAHAIRWNGEVWDEDECLRCGLIDLGYHDNPRSGDPS